MKTFLKIFIMLVVTMSSLAADESIDEQISAIQNAPAEQRLELMNKFKMKLAKMNFEERSKAIESIRSQGSDTHSATPQQHHIMRLQSQHSESLQQVQNIKRQQISSHTGTPLIQGGGSGSKLQQGKQ